VVALGPDREDRRADVGQGHRAAVDRVTAAAEPVLEEQRAQ
jgi:hypothetical protein